LMCVILISGAYNNKISKNAYLLECLLNLTVMFQEILRQG